MNPQKIGVRYGSLIKLKSEFEERYIILHRHTFPEVQQRLYDSHIRNFSIFLKDGTLFSYFEYVGDNYSEDMERIAQDAATQDWWKLTGPMQIPLENRENGEWWASMPELFFSIFNAPSSSQTLRFASVASVRSIPEISDQPEGLREAGIDKLSLFYRDKQIYAYGELGGDGELKRDPLVRESALSRFLNSTAPETGCSDWHPMSEVFHMGID